MSVLTNNNSSSIQSAMKLIEQKKPTNTSNSIVVSIQQTKNSSKSPRLDEKIDLIKKKVEDARKSNNDLKNLSSTKSPKIIKNPSSSNSNGLNPFKKHSTSTNSPKNMLLNFKKEIILNNKELVKDEKINTKNNPSISSQRQKDEQSAKKLLSLNLNKNNIIQSTTNEKQILDLSKSLENILETSNCSVKSTLRESNYYKKEAEKLSKYIKNCITFLIQIIKRITNILHPT